jgi:hypothetical protein
MTGKCRAFLTNLTVLGQGVVRGAVTTGEALNFAEDTQKGTLGIDAQREVVKHCCATWPTRAHNGAS